MTNEPGSTEPTSGESGGGGGPAEDIQRQFNDAVGKLTGPGEPLIVLGAILLVFVDIFGDLLFDEYFPTYHLLVPAWFVIAGVVLYRFRNSALPVSYPLLLAVLGFAAGFVGVREIIDDLDNSIFDADSGTIIFGMIAWAGGVLMLVGAIQLWPTVNKS